MFRRRSRQYDRYREVNQGISTPAAAAAAAASAQRLSSSAAAEALRRHSLTQSDQTAMAQFDANAARGGMRRSASMTLAESQYARRTSFTSPQESTRTNSLTRRNSLTSHTTVNRDQTGRTMSLTTTTVRQLGSFQLVSTKETPVRAPRTSQSHGSLRTQYQHQPTASFQESINSFDSELSVVREEPEFLDRISESPQPGPKDLPRDQREQSRGRQPAAVAAAGVVASSPLVNVTNALDSVHEGDETIDADTTIDSFIEAETTADHITDLENQLRLENIPDTTAEASEQFLMPDTAPRSRSRSPMKPALRERKNSTASNTSERRNTHVSFETAHTEEYVYDAYDYDDYEETGHNPSALADLDANGNTHVTTVTAAALAAAKAKQLQQQQQQQQQQRSAPTSAQRQAQRRAAQAAARASPAKQQSPRNVRLSPVSTAAAAAASSHNNVQGQEAPSHTPDSEGDSVYSDAEDEFPKEQPQRRPMRQGLEQKQLSARPNPAPDSAAARALAAAAAISNSNGHLPTSIPRQSSIRTSVYKPRVEAAPSEVDSETVGHHYRALLDDAASITSDSSFKRDRRSSTQSSPVRQDNIPQRNPQRMATTLRSQDRLSSLTGRSKRPDMVPSSPAGGFRSYSLRNQARPDPAQLMADANSNTALGAPPAVRPGGGLFSLRGDAPNMRTTRRTSVSGSITTPTQSTQQASRFVSRFSRDSDSEDEAFTAAINSISSEREQRRGFKSMFAHNEDVKAPQRYSSAPEPRQKRGFFKRLFSRG